MFFLNCNQRPSGPSLPFINHPKSNLLRAAEQLISAQGTSCASPGLCPPSEKGRVRTCSWALRDGTTEPTALAVHLQLLPDAGRTHPLRNASVGPAGRRGFQVRALRPLGT